MKTSTYAISACQFCRYYQLQGRRGGTCEQLGVPVKAGWKACSLALPPFAPSWETLEEIWQNDRLMLKEDMAVAYSQGCSQSNLPVETIAATAKPLMAEMIPA